MFRYVLGATLWWFLSQGVEATLGVTRLRPNASIPVRPDRSITFSFAPTSVSRGVSMKKFRIQVWRQSELVKDTGEILSSVPKLSLSLPSGRYQWGVQWWSNENQMSQIALSEVVVAVHSDEWVDVPWMGTTQANEFYADVNNLGKIDDHVEVLVAALGFGYVTVNGLDVSNDLLSPSGWTNTEKRVLFRTYDVTSLLNKSRGGRIFVGLGCGYRCDNDSPPRFPAYLDPANQAAQKSNDSIPKVFRLQVRVGGKRVFHSGSEGWWQRQGATVSDSVYGGELFMPGAAESWSVARALPLGHGPHGEMVLASFPGVQVIRKDAPVSITKPTDGVFVVDFGSNVAGVCQISIPSAATVTLKHGELLQHSGLPDVKQPDPTRVYFGNLRSAEANDTLVVENGGIKDWFPRFTYHGFRYVEIYGYPGDLKASSIQRLVMSTALEPKSHGHFSDEVLQQIHLGSKGTQRSNLMQLPTDCPQRDERLGWMGDASLSAASFLNHFHYESMAAAFLDSMVDEMGDDGSLTDVVPNQRFGGRPSDLSWNAAFLATMWALLQQGDTTSARIHWASVKMNANFLEAQVNNAGGISKVPEKYGDWCPPPEVVGHGQGAKPSKGFAAAFSLINSLQQAADLGEAIGGDAKADAARYKSLAQKLRGDFHAAYFNNETGTYDNGCMTSYVLPLALRATPDTLRASVFNNLVKYIEEHNKTWWGGIINNRFLFDVLHDNGRADLALSMLTRKEYPSYGYMYFNDLEPARECMWELPDAPFEGTGMNSRNHHMFSSIGKYLLEKIGGLEMVGESHLEALAGNYAGSVKVTIESGRGTASLSWSQASNTELNITVPVGMTAHVRMPVSTGNVFLEGSKISSFSDLPIGMQGMEIRRVASRDYHFLKLHSGVYSFSTGSLHSMPELVV